jgi:hypothetical protein
MLGVAAFVASPSDAIISGQEEEANLEAAQQPPLSPQIQQFLDQSRYQMFINLDPQPGPVIKNR